MKKPSFFKVKYYNNSFRITVANRAAMNLIEQMIPFLFGLYAYATWCNVLVAVKIGWSWIFFRSYYSIVFSMPFPALFALTIPAYFCVWFLIGKTFYTVYNLAEAMDDN